MRKLQPQQSLQRKSRSAPIRGPLLVLTPTLPLTPAVSQTSSTSGSPESPLMNGRLIGGCPEPPKVALLLMDCSQKPLASMLERDLPVGPEIPATAELSGPVWPRCDL